MKSEVANRKETEIHFQKLIDKRVTEITEQFNIAYLNNLYEMKDKINKFDGRQKRIDVKAKEIKAFIEGTLVQ